MDIQALRDFIEQHRDTPFKWGSHDCVLFAHKALQKAHGDAFRLDFIDGLDYNNEAGARLTLGWLARRFGEPNIIGIVDSKLSRTDTPRTGDAACIEIDDWPGWRFGVVLDEHIAAPGKKGLVFTELRLGDAFWRPY